MLEKFSKMLSDAEKQKIAKEKAKAKAKALKEKEKAKAMKEKEKAKAKKEKEKAKAKAKKARVKGGGEGPVIVLVILQYKYLTQQQIDNELAHNELAQTKLIDQPLAAYKQTYRHLCEQIKNVQSNTLKETGCLFYHANIPPVPTDIKINHTVQIRLIECYANMAALYDHGGKNQKGVPDDTFKKSYMTEFQNTKIKELKVFSEDETERILTQSVSVLDAADTDAFLQSANKVYNEIRPPPLTRQPNLNLTQYLTPTTGGFFRKR